MNVNALPPPGPSYDDGYDLVMQFESVLNLPERAKVVLDGVAVGVVSNVALTDRDVDVTARMARGVAVPSDIHAVLQQATVLGDIYVALERPTPDATRSSPPALAAGAAIPISQTTSPPQLEDTIASLANFVSSGSIQRFQNTLIKINRIAPSSEETRVLTGRIKTDLSALANNLDSVDQVLNGLANTADVVDARVPDLQYLASPTGQRGAKHFAQIANYVATVLPGIGSITLGGYWLVPFLNSAADASGALQESKVAGETEIPKYRNIFNDMFLATEKYPAINIRSIIGPDGRELSGNVQEVLRILGATP
ncbi:mammalian cell entry protein [Mycobacterium sp. Root135]|nr:mammalian cell entry protein [Mycobacterium sp. Root135]